MGGTRLPGALRQDKGVRDVCGVVDDLVRVRARDRVRLRLRLRLRLRVRLRVRVRVGAGVRLMTSPMASTRLMMVTLSIVSPHSHMRPRMSASTW